jgi:hypothetical protein
MMIRYQFTLYSIAFGSLSRENRDYIHLELEAGAGAESRGQKRDGCIRYHCLLGSFT